MMNFIQVVTFSLVEGITEFLPVSSTGHLILTARILNIIQTDFVKTFEIFIQLGAILAVTGLYFKTFIRDKFVFLKTAFAFFPTGLVGLALYPFIKRYLLGNVPVTVFSLFTGGVILIIAESRLLSKIRQVEQIENISFRQAFYIGLIQSISIVPGVSRSAASIVGGMFLGLSRKPATEFSFLLAIPTIFAATMLDLYKSNFSFSRPEWIILLTGAVIAFISSYATVKLLLKYIAHHSFVIFGVYRIILALAFLTIVSF